MRLTSILFSYWEKIIDMSATKNIIMDPVVSVEFEVFGKVQGKFDKIYIFLLVCDNVYTEIFSNSSQIWGRYNGRNKSENIFWNSCNVSIRRRFVYVLIEKSREDNNSWNHGYFKKFSSIFLVFFIFFLIWSLIHIFSEIQNRISRGNKYSKWMTI